MTEVYVVLPLSILDELWPTGVTLRSRRAQTPEYWIAHLDRYVDMGVLVRTGDGSEARPYRYERFGGRYEPDAAVLRAASRKFLRDRGIVESEFARGLAALAGTRDESC